MPLFDVRDTGGRVSFSLIIPGTPYINVHYFGARVGNELRLVSPDDGQGVFTLTAFRVIPGAPPASVPLAAPVPAATPAPTPAPVAAAPTPAAPTGTVAFSPTAPLPPPGSAAPAPQIFSQTASLPAPRPTVAPPAPPPPPPGAAAPPLPQPRVASIAPPPATTPPQGSQPVLGSLPPQGSLPPAAPTQGVQVAPSTIAPPIPPPTAPPPPAPVIAAGPPVKLPLPPLRDVAANGLMRIPPMGWASRQRLGTDIDDAAIRQAADGLDETPLKAAGYTYCGNRRRLAGHARCERSHKREHEIPRHEGARRPHPYKGLAIRADDFGGAEKLQRL